MDLEVLVHIAYSLVMMDREAVRREGGRSWLEFLAGSIVGDRFIDVVFIEYMWVVSQEE